MMKIIAVSEEMFEHFCDKLTPMQRGAGGIMAARCFYLYAQQALIVVAGDCTIGTLADMPIPSHLRDLGAAAKACETSPLGKVQADSPGWRPHPPVSAFTEKHMRSIINVDVAALNVGVEGLVGSANHGLYERFTDKAKNVVFFARYEAQQNGCREIDCAHLLLGILREEKNLIRQLRPDLEVTEIIRKHIKDDCMRHVPGGVEKTSDPMLERHSKAVIREASMMAKSLGNEFIGPEHILAALASSVAFKTNNILSHVGITPNIVANWVAKRDAASVPPPISSDDVTAESRVVVKEYPNSIDLEVYVDGVLRCRTFHPDPLCMKAVEAFRAVYIDQLREGRS